MKKTMLVLVVLTAATFLSGCGANTCCNTGYSSCCGGSAVGNWY